MKPSAGWLLILQTVATVKDARTMTLDDNPVPLKGATVCYDGRDGKSIVGTVLGVKYDYRTCEVIVTLGAVN